jgi:hypothetical protein
VGFSLTDLLSTVGRSVVGALPIPGSNILAGLVPGGGGGGGYTNSPYVPDVIENIYNPPPATTGTPAMSNCSSVPIVMAPQATTVMKAPPGYVVVMCRGQKVAMLKPVARSLGLWKPRKKPPIKVSDWQALMKADRTIKKLKMVTKKAGVIQRGRGRK